ncbi:cytochrome c oxidase assembly protein [bacterium]|nr:cytochrome c oxidase assembly protein [bacterium]
MNLGLATSVEVLGAAVSGAPWTVVAALVSITVYSIGRRRLVRGGRRTAARFPRWRQWSFGLGWLGLLVAIATPLDAAAERSLSAHMIQHMLLAMVVPPLWWFGAPAMPMLMGLPRSWRSGVVGPIFAAPWFRAVFRRAVHPVVGWVLMAVTTLGWHVPAAYELAIQNPTWHLVEHVSMLGAGLVFWLPVVAPFPYRSPWPRIALIPYLVSADLVNTVVSAALAFAEAPVYSWYGKLAAARGIDAVLDQQLAAGLMWVPGNLVYLIPAMVITVRWMLGGSSVAARPRTVHPPQTISLPVLSPHRDRGDLLRVPMLGRLLRSPAFRLGIRLATLAGAVVIALDGMLGPDESPMNLAGTLPWTHWRGVTVVLLLVLGNVACFACPLIAPRSVLRRWISPRWRWPRRFRSKWLAVGLVVVWLVAYEAFDLWDSPLATAMLIIGLVGAATAVDLLFEGASFCRYVCPVGQYQMALSTISTRTVAAIDPDRCTTCTTHDCLAGGPRGPGCGLDLLIPSKSGNLDCTFCLDCVTACPHDNVGLVRQVPGLDLAEAGWRSGIGRLSRRLDFGVLLAVLTVGGIVNAAGMTGPVVGALDEISGNEYRTLVAAVFVVVSILLGLGVLSLAAIGDSSASRPARLTRAGLAAAPLGAAMWVVHFGFHLVTGWPTAEASMVRVTHDLGLSQRLPDRIMSCCVPPPDWMLPLELGVLSLGVAGSLGVAWWGWRAIAVENNDRVTAASITRRWLPSAAVLITLWAVTAWIVFQPMEMRGTSGFMP